jgi:hypothetical protein
MINFEKNIFLKIKIKKNYYLEITIINEIG